MGRIALRVSPLCGKFSGVDISPKTIKRATKNLAERNNVALHCGDFLDLEFSEFFDVIYSTLTFMHIKRKEDAVKKVRALLKPCGLFVLSIDKSTSNILKYGSRRLRLYPDTPEYLTELMKKNGFSEIRVCELEMAHLITATVLP